MSAARRGIQSVPAAHTYVQHSLTPASPGQAGFNSSESAGSKSPESAGLTLLPDPPVPGATVGQWWPSPVLEPSWPAHARETVDVVHLHFGFEHRSASQLEQWCAATAAAGLALVLTVHDLQNPHLHDQRPHLESLGVLVPRAHAVITLTPGAASEILRRWGVHAQVLPHPHVVPADRLGHRPPRLSGPQRFGLPMGALRANVDPQLVPRLLAVLPPAAELHLSLRPGRREQLLKTSRLGTEFADPRLRIVERAAGSEHDFADHVAEFDVLVLPYRHGTHSGWVEAAHDVGVPVVAPAVGYWHEQHPLHRYELDDDHSLAQALGSAADQRLDPAPAAQRLAQRREIAGEHARLYRRLTTRRESR